MIMQKNFDYSPEKNGVVMAIRLFNRGGTQIMAELAFAFGGSVVVDWTNPTERSKYEKGINAYTLYYDERAKKDFTSWVKPMSSDN